MAVQGFIPLWVAQVSLYQRDKTETDRASLPRVPPCRRRCFPRGSIFRVPLVTPTACDGKTDCADSLTGAMLVGALVSATYDPNFFSALNIGVDISQALRADNSTGITCLVLAVSRRRWWRSSDVLVLCLLSKRFFGEEAFGQSFRIHSTPIPHLTGHSYT